MNAPSPENRRGPDPGLTLDQLGVVQLFDMAVLSAVAKGQLDLNRLAVETLADRGLDRDGHWIGFGEARKHHGLEGNLPETP